MADEKPVSAVAAYLGLDTLPPFSQPKMDLVGPTANDDIRRAITRYGADAVKAAVKEATKAKRGRPLERDWYELRDVIQADAREWLAGGDPFSVRSNYAIAKEFSERNPGHSVISTHQRVERKLSRGPRGRRWWTLVNAEVLSRDDYPYAAHLKALEALAALPDGRTAETWQWNLDRARSTIADFEAREGKSPEPSMSFRKIEERVRKGGLAALIGLAPSEG